MLKAKLCRYLTKLEIDKTRVYSDSTIYKKLFSSISSLLKGIIKKAIGQVKLD